MSAGLRTWKPLLENPPAGAHLILWGDGSKESDVAIESFLRGGVIRNELVLVVLPRDELRGFGDRMRGRGLDIEAMTREGHVIRGASEDIGPRRSEDVARIPKELEAFGLLAKNLGKSGLTVLWRVAPPFFERGESEMANLVERATQTHLRNMRFLCWYGANDLLPGQFADAVSLTRSHTHAITALGGPRFLVETIARPLEPLLA